MSRFSPLWAKIDGGWDQNNFKKEIFDSKNPNFDIFHESSGSFLVLHFAP